MLSRFLLTASFSCAALGLLSGRGVASEASDHDFFEAKIRPLLVEKCYECHGDQKQKGGLRLDSKQGWIDGGEQGPVIVPGNPDASLLIKAVRYRDETLQMPPKHPLAEAEVADLVAWVQQGAEDPRSGAPSAKGMDLIEGRKYWAFQPLAPHQPPAVPGDRWSQTEIDPFILAKLQQVGLQPSAPADRRSLLRRASFDLTGLPPSPAEVADFLADPSDDAWPKVIDRLLNSSSYGEHWARHWLDLARYSDTKGYVYGREEARWVHAWPYRDWVVQAFNEDLPYDRFLKLQLAADQFVPAGSPDLAAMGFLTLGRRFLGVTQDIIDDRIDVVMRTTQGLTVACARCHDHKFDPIPTSDYYSLYGIFQSCAETLVPCAPPPDASAEFAAELTKRQEKLRATSQQRREEQAARVRAKTTEHLLAQLELEKYPEETFVQLISADDINPLFVRRWQHFLSTSLSIGDRFFSAWHQFAAIPPEAFAVKSAALTKTLAALPPEKLHPLVAKAFAAAPTSMTEVAQRYGSLFHEVETAWQALLQTTPDATALPQPDEEEIRQVLYGPNSPGTVPDEHIANIEWFFTEPVGVELWKLQGEVDRLLIETATAPAYATILQDRATPVTPRIFKRGNPRNKGASVPRQFLQVLSGDAPFSQGSGRRQLAESIASAQNPLTARVMVNRVWRLHFGEGFVPTTSDFGKRAELPSHPELLDWLAQRFIDDGWSLKKLHQRILRSAAWQQNSSGPAQAPDLLRAQETDPANRLLWRMNPHRLSFEERRDASLQITNELTNQIAGKPSPLFDSANHRRTLYATIDRQSLPTALRTFDFANPDLSIPQRNDTIVPQQALFELNHPFPAARARALAQSCTAVAGSLEAAIRTLYRKAFQRAPTDEETAAALAFLQATEPSARPPDPWRYGYGALDETAARLSSFTPLPFFTGKAWQGGPVLPDPALGWASLSADGGHPGNDLSHACVRRWIAPADGSYSVSSTLTHTPEEGDGIRAFICYSGGGILQSTTLHHNHATMNTGPIAMKAGETLDFIVDIDRVLNSDQFLWAPTISPSPPGSPGPGPQWQAQTDFSGTATADLTPWEQLAQTLLLSNEFVFID